jgi:hypothetical protein
MQCCGHVNGLARRSRLEHISEGEEDEVQRVEATATQSDRIAHTARTDGMACSDARNMALGNRDALHVLALGSRRYLRTKSNRTVAVIRVSQLSGELPPLFLWC